VISQDNRSLQEAATKPCTPLSLTSIEAVDMSATARTSNARSRALEGLHPHQTPSGPRLMDIMGIHVRPDGLPHR